MNAILKQLPKMCRCGACGKSMDRVNLVTLDLRATWEFPAHGNALADEPLDGAVAVVCDRCLKEQRAPREAVELVSRPDPDTEDGVVLVRVVYHPVETLAERN